MFINFRHYYEEPFWLSEFLRFTPIIRADEATDVSANHNYTCSMHIEKQTTAFIAWDKRLHKKTNTLFETGNADRIGFHIDFSVGVHP